MCFGNGSRKVFARTATGQLIGTLWCCLVILHFSLVSSSAHYTGATTPVSGQFTLGYYWSTHSPHTMEHGGTMAPQYHVDTTGHWATSGHFSTRVHIECKRWDGLSGLKPTTAPTLASFIFSKKYYTADRQLECWSQLNQNISASLIVKGDRVYMYMCFSVYCICICIFSVCISASLIVKGYRVGVSVKNSTQRGAW